MDDLGQFFTTGLSAHNEEREAFRVWGAE